MIKVLLVEDELWLGELYQVLLTKSGCQVNWCRDGYDAMESIDASRPDVLVLDLLLPWASGLQVLHEIASYRDLRHIAIILCSNALPKELDITLLAHYGVVETLDKSHMHPRQLVSAVKRAADHEDISD